MTSRATAGPLAPGQSLFSVTLRESSPSAGTTTFQLLTVPSGMTFFVTDLQANGAAIAAAAEIVLTLNAGTIAITQVSLGSSSPIALQYETQPFATAGAVLSLAVTNANATTPAFSATIAGYLQASGY